jgi:hypothetical protein
MPLLEGDEELLSRHVAVCKTRLELARRLLKHCPQQSENSPAWIPREINDALIDTIGTLTYLERHILA